MALSTARIHKVRGRPPLLAAGIRSLIHSHSSSVRSLGYIFVFIYPFYTTHEDFSDRLLGLIDEMDEMSRDDKINKITSYMRVLLIHLIKQVVEKRSTRSWEDSIEESLDSIAATNKRRSSGGYY